MKITKEIIKAIIDSRPEDSNIPLEEILETGIDRIKAIRSRILECENKIEDIQKKADAQIFAFRKLIQSTKEECRHESTSYHPDPSGNNDSYYKCDICGAEL